MSPWLTKRFAPRLWEAAQKWQADDGPTWAASLGYYAAFSFFPLVMMLLAGAAMVLRYARARAKFRSAQLLKMLAHAHVRRFRPESERFAGRISGGFPGS